MLAYANICYLALSSAGDDGNAISFAGITKVIRIHALGTMSVCIKFHGDPSKSLLRNFGLDQNGGPTLPSLEPHSCSKSSS